MRNENKNAEKEIKGAHIIIILGHANSKKGQLSDIYKSRLEKGYREFIKKKNHKKDFKILCTGGFGWHFNKTKKPHGRYGEEYLLSRGVPEKCFLPVAMSKNTIQDALLSKKIIDGLKDNRLLRNKISLIIVSSDFHMPRVKYIFARVFDEYFADNKKNDKKDNQKYDIKYEIKFAESRLTISKIKLARLKAHERLMLLKMKSSKPLSKLYDAAKSVFSRGFQSLKKD